MVTFVSYSVAVFHRLFVIEQLWNCDVPVLPNLMLPAKLKTQYCNAQIFIDRGTLG